MISRCRASRPDLERCPGFTLIEVIVTLTILGLALVIVAGYKAPWSSGLGLKGTASELASGLRLARSEAIASNRPVAFDLDVNDHLYRVGTGAKRRLPANLSIELLTINGESRGASVGDIRFNPDGSSTGGRIALADGTRHMAVGVDWLTGRVSVANIR
ncbi:MAG: GspH/FimT family pseudopilin [Alphaproteobacteria bacterium]|nr:GspH/FimT family pseudopilin [Alphaproteobacteria bacterium]